MKEKLHPNKLVDYTEKTWFLGTDILDDERTKDLELMSQGIATSFYREEGAIYNTQESFQESYKQEGYSPYFQEVIKEAKSRGYDWVFFDRDIETSSKKG